MDTRQPAEAGRRGVQGDTNEARGERETKGVSSVRVRETRGGMPGAGLRDMEPKLKSICAWCYPGVTHDEDGRLYTHGICKVHFDEAMKEARDERNEQ